MGGCGSKPKVKEEAANPFYPAERKLQVKEVTQPRLNVILNNPYPELEGKELTLHYELGQELGRGEFGITCLVKNKFTGEKLACKTISKRKLKSPIDIEDVRREVAILHLLPAHPNIVGLRGVYEDKLAVHLIQELCEGGELFERIISRGHYSERAAAQVTKTIVEIVQVTAESSTNGGMCPIASLVPLSCTDLPPTRSDASGFEARELPLLARKRRLGAEGHRLRALRHVFARRAVLRSGGQPVLHGPRSAAAQLRA